MQAENDVVAPQQEATSPSEPKTSPMRYTMGEERRGAGARKILLILLVLLLVGGAVGGFIFVSNRQSEEEVTQTPTPTQVPTSIPTPTSQTTPTPTGKQSPTPTKKATKGLTVRILNGSGVIGAAKQAADYLSSLGYEIISVGNADITDLDKTIIEIKKAKESLLAQLKIDLETKYSIGTTSATLSATDSADAVVTVGKK